MRNIILPEIKEKVYIIANYVSLYGYNEIFPEIKTNKEFYQKIYEKFNIKNNTFRNYRDMFDGYNDSKRKGWYQKELDSIAKKVKQKYLKVSKENYTEIVKELFNYL